MRIALVLLAEDEKYIAELLIESLEEGGFSVLAVPNGKAATEVIANADDLQALVTDIRLGSGPDGWEVAHVARHRFPELPVVYISGDSAHEWTEKGVPKSVFIQKPFAPVQIVTAVSTLLNKAE